MRITNRARRICALIIAATFAVNVPAQSFVYPGKGQSADQQKKDEGECHVWAVQQSKYDPTKPPAQAAAAKPPCLRGRLCRQSSGRGRNIAIQGTQNARRRISSRSSFVLHG